MPSSYHNDIIVLKNSYQQLRWFDKLFFPYRLATALEHYPEDDADDSKQLTVFKAFENNTWFFHQWFFTYLKHFSGLNNTKNLRILNSAGLLTNHAAQANFSAVVAHKNPKSVASALWHLEITGLLTGDAAQANFDAVVARHQQPLNVANALSTLDHTGLLTGDTAQANRDAVIAHANPGLVSDALETLYKGRLLTGDAAQANFDAVVKHQNPRLVADALRTLHNAGHLKGDTAQANRDAVVDHENPALVAEALRELDYYYLLTGDTAQANRYAVVKHQNPRLVADALRILDLAGLSEGDTAQANRNAVVKHQNPRLVADALRTLHNAGLLKGDTAQANRDAVAEHKNPELVADALRKLHTARLLTGDTAQANRYAVVKHQNPRLVADALRTLNNARLLTGDAAQANRDAVVKHENPALVAHVLRELHLTDLLTGDTAQANRDAVVAHQDARSVAAAISRLHDAGRLTGDTAQANFDAVFITYAAILLHPNNRHNEVSFWNAMPPEQLRAEQFQVMIQIAHEHAENPDAGSQALMNYVIPLIPIPNVNRQQNRQQPIFNANQSTHTASVHKSASQTAINLRNRYQTKIANKILLDGIVNEFAPWVHERTPKDLKQQAAARCIDRLKTTDYCYIDMGSNVSTRQLIALAWVAVHDKTCLMETSVDDAKQQLIDALYESQRGYNLSEFGADNLANKDSPICAAGTFNKLCEKLTGVHEDATLLFITPKGAAAKLPIVAREEAKKYLAMLKPDSQEYNKIFQEQGGTLNYLWEQISKNVADQLFEEYGSLYQEGKDSPKFHALVSTGVYALDFTQLTQLATQPAVTSSPHAFFQGKER